MGKEEYQIVGETKWKGFTIGGMLAHQSASNPIEQMEKGKMKGISKAKRAKVKKA